MNNNIPEKVLQDEVVKFISERHHTTAQHLIAHLPDLELEENEQQIIRDLIRMYERR